MPAQAADTPDALAQQPTTSWAPERQMANMLLLCEAQMSSALQESDQAVDSLIHAFTQLADTVRDVGAPGSELPAESQTRPAGHLDQQLSRLAQQVNSAIVAFQFYDKLTQRLGHVRYSLNSAAELVRDPEQMQRPAQWQQLHSSLRSMYRTAEEREIFQMMMDREQGTPAGLTDWPAAPDVSGDVYPDAGAAQPAGDIELF